MAVRNLHAAPTALLAEDEANLRDELREALCSLWPELQIVACAVDGGEALQLWEQHQPDILFLDIHMPGQSGLRVAEHASGRSHIVFVTAYDQHAIEAFQHGAVDYVLKPFDRSRLALTVERLKSRVDASPGTVDALLQQLARTVRADPGYMRWITAAQGQEVRLITTDEICYFRADHKYTLVATATRDALITRPIKDLLESLDPGVFWQIHRSTIVNIHHVAGIARDIRGKLCVKLKQRKDILTVSAAHAHKFRQM